MDDYVDYVYNPLMRPSSIRVLTLYSARKLNDEIHCELHRNTLEAIQWEGDPNHLPVEALSYVWGQTERPCQIICNNKRLYVTPNCHAALRHLRKLDEPRRLWVDSICMNQADDSEKNHQVKLMGEIYSRASRVIVWLGEGPRDVSPSDFRRITRAASLETGLETGLPIMLKIFKVSNEEFWTAAIQQAITVVFNDGPAIEDIRRKVQIMLRFFEQNDWFYRIWTFQEIAFAKDAVFMFGQFEITLSEFERWLRYGMHLREYRIRDVNLSQNWLRLCTARLRIRDNVIQEATQRRYDNPNKHSGTLLNRVCDHKCTKPQDMVYAIQPILLKDGLILPEPDYDKPVRDVYEETTMAIIEESKGLEILIHSRCPPRIALEGLPSWVPDWYQSIGLDPLGNVERVGTEIYILDGRPRPPRDSDDWSLHSELPNIHHQEPYATRHSYYEIPIGRRWGELPLKGYRLGKIRNIAPFLLDLEATRLNKKALEQAWTQALQAVAFAPEDINGRLRMDFEFTEWLRLMLHRDPRISSKGNLLHGPDLPDSMHYRIQIGDQQVFNLSSSGLGIGDRHIRNGDIVVMAHGSDYPLVLRPTERKGYFRFVGCAYIWGAMRGELWPERRFSWKTIKSTLMRTPLEVRLATQRRGRGLISSFFINIVEDLLFSKKAGGRNLKEFILV